MEIHYEQKLIRTNGIALNVVQAGPETGKPVVLLHGFPEFWYGWRHQIDHLASRGLHVWVPDQRGYNLSDKPRDVFDYRIDELVLDIVGVIKATGHEKVMLAGHDWGAMVAWWLALRHPQIIEKLAILNVPHPRVFQRHLRINPRQFMKSWYAGFFQVPFLPESLFNMADGRAFANVLRLSGKRSTFSQEELAHYREAWQEPYAARSMLNWYRAYLRHAPEPPASWRVRIPTLIIWGLRDVALSRDMVEPSADLCDNVEVVELEKATHWVQHDEKERVSQLLGLFFA